MISGVASGLADYFDVDPTLVRLVFIISALIHGIGIFVYIVMSFIVPIQEKAPESNKAIGKENEGMADSTSEGAQPPLEPLAAEPGTHWRHREQRHTWAGVILIALGVLFLAQNVGFLFWWNWRIFWPVVLICVGALLLVRRLQR